MCIPFLSFIVPIFAWTTRISNQSILKEGLMLKFQHFGHLMSRIDSIEKKKNPWFWERLKTGVEQDDRGWDGWMGRSWWWEAWHAEVHGVTKNQIQLSWTELALNLPLIPLIILKRSLVFPILLFSSVSFHCWLRKAFLSLFTILWNSSFRWVYLSFSPLPFTSLLFSAICKALSDNHFAFLHLFFGW